MIDLGTGNNNKINWAFNNKQELIDIIEVVYRGARKGIFNIYEIFINYLIIIYNIIKYNII